MILRIALFITLLAAITTLMAAPPRFSVNTTTPPALTKPSNPHPQVVSPEAEQATKGDAALDKMKNDHARLTEQQSKPKREPLIRWRPHKPKPKIKTYKSEEELVPTELYHMREVEQISAGELHRYSAGYQSFWKVNSSKSLCQMTQNIPHYGRVEFRQGVGQPLEFALYVTNPPAGVGRARIRTEPPQWEHFNKRKDLGVIELGPGERAVSAPADWSRRLFLELSEGMQPVLSYWDAADATDDMEVMLSALNFQNSMDLFNRCVGQLLRYDFKSAKRTIVYFHPDSSKLRGKAKKQLDDVLELLKIDEGIKQLDVELYTVDRGLVRYNFRLATRRARAVRDYLIKRGANEEEVLIKIHTLKQNKLKETGYKTTDVHVVLRRKVAK